MLLSTFVLESFCSRIVYYFDSWEKGVFRWLEGRWGRTRKVSSFQKLAVIWQWSPLPEKDAAMVRVPIPGWAVSLLLTSSFSVPFLVSQQPALQLTSLLFLLTVHGSSLSLVSSTSSIYSTVSTNQCCVAVIILLSNRIKSVYQM